MKIIIYENGDISLNVNSLVGWGIEYSPIQNMFKVAGTVNVGQEDTWLAIVKYDDNDTSMLSQWQAKRVIQTIKEELDLFVISRAHGKKKTLRMDELVEKYTALEMNHQANAATTEGEE